MKQFNLDEYLANPLKKVVTRDGRNVRIVCTDRKSKSNRPIIALIEDFGGEENFLCYPSNGEWPTCRRIDLFFAPERKEGWVNLYRGNIDYIGGCVYTSKEEAEENIGNKETYVATIKIEWKE